jgi:NADH-quinone oxidoreductase subunit N
MTLQAHELRVYQPSVWLVPGSFGVAVGAIAALTITIGNLAAFGQTNLKRLLAYSTIAHAGYMLLAVSTITRDGTASILYYLIAYIAMNLGAFAVVTFVRNTTRSEDLSAYRGLIQRSPVLAITMTVFLLSLLGLPPLAGLPAKFQAFKSVYDTANSAVSSGRANLGIAFYVLLGIASVNIAISAYYYLKVVRVMLLEKSEGEEASEASVSERKDAIQLGPYSTLYLIVLSLALFVAFIAWNPLINAAERAADAFGLKR